MVNYKDSGVNYEEIDPFKLRAQLAARGTADNILRLGDGKFHEFSPSRGESVFLIETPTGYLAHVEEGLGTKSLVADAMYALTGRSYYDQIAQCTVATFVNDMITLGALPLSVAMHIASGNSNWFQDERRAQDLINGWRHACDLARCVWGGGETPTLKGIVAPDTVVLSGSAIGVIEPKERLIQGDIEPGDTIVFIESSGIHANGLTMARQIADKLPEGYLTALPDGRTYGETLLDPTHIYVRLIEHAIACGVRIHYAVNITGHGWRKLMRATKPFTYVVESLPTQLPIFDFMQKHGPITDEEAYGNLNMGAGFALYVSSHDACTLVEIGRNTGLHVRLVGHIENGPRKVVVKPKGLEFAGETLAVR